MPRQIRTKKRRQRQLRQELDKNDVRREAARSRALREVERQGEDLEEIADDIAEEMHRTVKDQATPVPVKSATLEGRVVEYRGRTVRVRHRGEDYSCRLRSTTIIPSSDSTPVAVGDLVKFVPAAQNEGVIREILPRNSRLSRASRIHHEIEQVLVANVDQLLLVASVREPHPKPEFIDRVLIAAACQSLPAIICFNKIDLEQDDSINALAAIYQQAGYQVIKTSANSGNGLAELDALLRGKLTVAAGQSGVGKSSLANALDCSLDLKVGRVISSSHKGRHTTTRSILLPYRDDGFLIDTPGLRLFELWQIQPDDLRDYFPEFRRLAPDCHFNSCQHRSEPGCAVKAALEQGELSEQRYRSYLHICDTL
ncbi:MAG: ribosome small subunit-dependent GTPase A [Candidatus Delongbacteria bacterium]|nr:ribosome small subunit-dependent GTPase A [Candidatus Delongbacteria bacterium]